MLQAMRGAIPAMRGAVPVMRGVPVVCALTRAMSLTNKTAEMVSTALSLGDAGEYASRQLQNAMDYKCNYQPTRGWRARQLVFVGLDYNYRASVCWSVTDTCAVIEWITVEPIQQEESTGMPSMVAQQWVVWLVNQACRMIPGDFTVVVPKLKPDKQNLLAALEKAGMESSDKEMSCQADKLLVSSSQLLAQKWVPSSSTHVEHVRWQVA